MLSAVIPTLQSEATLGRCLASLRDRVDEMVVADGGSTDGTAGLAQSLEATVVSAPRGRGPQLAAGAAAAEGDWLLFLHADTVLVGDWRSEAATHMTDRSDRAAVFRLAFDDPSPRARRLERIVAWRTRALGLPYGDQGLLVSRALYDSVGGFRPLSLMEDVDLVRRLGKRRIVLLDAIAETSAARYRRDGWTVRSARNLFCLLLYFLGVPPETIERIYR